MLKSFLRSSFFPVLFITCFVVVVLIISKSKNNVSAIEDMPNDTSGPLIPGAKVQSERTGQSAPTALERIDRTLLPQEREMLARDPASSGWSESDRAFFEEHGVTESEARAMETIMRENGVE